MFDFVKKVFGKGKKEKTKEVKRSSIPEAVKFEVLSRQGHRCAFCGKFLKIYEFDHVVPVALGGTSDVNNVQALCPECHSFKTKFDRLLISRVKEMSTPKRNLVLKTVKRRWLFIGEYPNNLDGVPEWLLNGIPNFTFKINDDGYPFTFVRGKTFEYLVIMYSKGDYLFFKRFRRTTNGKGKRKRR
ncbi:HNH endonuclease [Archaeoglobus sp.]